MASATSRISAHAAVYKPHAQTASAPAGAGGADDASPFSILLNQVTAPKAKQQDTKDSQKDEAGTKTNTASTASTTSTASTASTASTGPENASSNTDPAANNDTTAAAPTPDTAAAPASDDTAVQPLPQLPSILLGQTNIADKTRMPDAGKTDVPSGKPKAKSPSDDTGKDGAAMVPADAAVQLALAAPPPPPAAPQAPLPTIASSDPAAGDDDDMDVEATAPAAVPAKAGPPGEGGAPLTSVPQTSVPQTGAPQASVPQPQIPQTGAPSTNAPPANANAADAKVSQPADDADADTQADAPAVEAAAVPAVNATAPKTPGKTAAAVQGQNSVKTVKPDAIDDDAPRAQQADPLPQPQAPQPPAPVQAKADTAPNLNGLIQPIATPTAADAPSATQASHIHVAPQDAMTPDTTLLAVQIAAKSQSGARQFDIRLDPPELGRVDVRLSIDASGKAQAHLSADQQGTLDMLQKDAPVLTRALRDAGLDVSQGGLNFSLRGQGGNGANADGNRGQGERRSFDMPVAAIKSVDFVTATWRSPVDGRLDISV